MKINRTAIIAVATLSVTSAICAASIAGYALGHPDQAPPDPVHSVNGTTAHPAQWTMKDLSDQNVSYLLANVLPYYRVNAPSWCPEDDTCWIGSNADSRTDRQIMDALACNIAQSGANYTFAKVPAGDLKFIRTDLCGDR